jgi:alpha-L-glutamate ligase-like protein
MMFGMFKELRDAGILGMNRRNAEYVMRHNPRARFPLVDNKVLTKQLAREFNIPAPELYHLIEHHGDTTRLEKALGSRKEFALKPARGSGGSGIVLITDRTPAGFVRQSGRTMPREDFFYHISGILSGIYSLGGQEDSAIVEALIHPAPIFELVSYRGVPDIRIIVYRGVPVMAMTRLPTRASDGKANIHAGAIGAGIDIARGLTLTAVHRSKVIAYHPDTGNLLAGIAIPGWDNLLLTAARAFEMTGLGYIGADFVIDVDRGPLLLELNARPGLQIQIANESGLLKRLESVDRASLEYLSSPEARVAWAKKEFAVPNGQVP